MDGDFNNSSKSMSFEDLNKRQQMFDEQLENLIRSAKAITFPVDIPQARKELSEQDVEELCTISKQQHEKQKLLVKEHDGLKEDVEKINKKIDELKEKLERYNKELSINKEELKQSIKPLKRAIKKYSVNFNMKVELQKIDEKDKFVASVQFDSSGTSKSVDFVFDRKRRCVVDFDAKSVLSVDEEIKLKQSARRNNSLDIKIILCKLRDHGII